MMPLLPEPNVEIISGAHTPGPWAIVDRDDSLVIKTESQAKTKYGASRYACLGGFDRHDDKQYAEAKANARLIAAAPDLLDALSVLVELVSFQICGDDHPAIINARAAIAKATGGAA